MKNTVHQRLTPGYACLVSCRVGMPTLSSRPGALEPSAVARSPTGSHEAHMPARKNPDRGSFRGTSGSLEALQGHSVLHFSFHGKFMMDLPGSFTKMGVIGVQNGEIRAIKKQKESRNGFWIFLWPGKIPEAVSGIYLVFFWAQNWPQFPQWARYWLQIRGSSFW